MNRTVLAAAILFVSPIAAPRLLAFPYHAMVAGHRVYSEQPVTSAVRAAVADGVQRASRSQLARGLQLEQPIILTDGGWRWHWLSLRLSDTYALSRPVIETVVINATDPVTATVSNGSAHQRTLASIVAHELTHGTIRARFGGLADYNYPAELREGYCDHVAGESTLGDAEARQLIAQSRFRPALTYWRGRKAVEAALARNGGDEAALFRSAS